MYESVGTKLRSSSHEIYCYRVSRVVTTIYLEVTRILRLTIAKPPAYTDRTQRSCIYEIPLVDLRHKGNFHFAYQTCSYIQNIIISERLFISQHSVLRAKVVF